MGSRFRIMEEYVGTRGSLYSLFDETNSYSQYQDFIDNLDGQVCPTGALTNCIEYIDSGTCEAGCQLGIHLLRYYASLDEIVDDGHAFEPRFYRPYSNKGLLGRLAVGPIRVYGFLYSPSTFVAVSGGLKHTALVNDSPSAAAARDFAMSLQPLIAKTIGRARTPEANTEGGPGLPGFFVDSTLSPVR